jgi:hypothetical protein
LKWVPRGLVDGTPLGIIEGNSDGEKVNGFIVGSNVGMEKGKSVGVLIDGAIVGIWEGIKEGITTWSQKKTKKVKY